MGGRGRPRLPQGDVACDHERMSGEPDSPRARPHLTALPGYEPVTPVDQLAARAGVDVTDVLKLDANENPFGASDAVQRAVAECRGWSVYPDPLQLDLRAALAGYAGVTPERVVAGAGSDELIELTVRALVGPGQRVVSCPPTFGMYRFLCDVAAIPLDEVERGADFGIDVEAVLAAIRPETALVILASPNNPSGTPLRDDALAALLGSGATIAVDEAYGEYAGTSALERFGDHPRLIVFRTFSKWAGLAGLRAGYGVFHPDLASVLLRIKQPYNVNLAAEVAMRAAIDAKDELLAQAAQVVEERGALARDIGALGWLTPYPSSANFLLCAVEGGSPDAGARLHAALAERGVFVRYFGTPRLRDCVRISCPRPDQHEALMTHLRAAGAGLGLA